MRLAVILALLLPAGAHGEARPRLAMSASDLVDWLDAVAKTGHRPAHVSAHVHDGKPVFTALAVPNPARLAWLSRHGLDIDGLDRLFHDDETKGHRLVTACAYLDGGHVRYLAVWVKDNQPVACRTLLAVPARSLEGVLDAESQEQGCRPAALVGLRTRHGPRYLLQLVGDDGAASLTRFGLTAAEYQKLLADYRAKKYRPAWASAFDDGGTPRFSAVLVQDAARPWEARHELSDADFKKADAAMGKRGLRLASLTGYRSGKATRYLAVWEGELDLPASGKEVPELAAFDAAMRRYMREQDVRCGVLAVMRGGKLVLSRGYGYARRDGGRRVAAGDPFRLGSVSKPFTAAAVWHLIEEGKLRLATPALLYLRVKPPDGDKMDGQLKRVTVRDLLAHEGGWDHKAAPLGDVLGQSERVARRLERKMPLGTEDYIRFMAGQPLQLAPGTKYVYSNFGYLTLGRVIEKASRMTFEQYLHKAVGKPLGLTSLRVGRSLPEKRGPNEPFYSHPSPARNLLTGKGLVPVADGGFPLEAAAGAGGLVASAPDVAKFYDAYLTDGRRRRGGPVADSFHGSLPGTYALARTYADGTVVVALFNSRHSPDGRAPERIQAMIDAVVKGVKKWP